MDTNKKDKIWNMKNCWESGREVANRRRGWEHEGREELAERGRFVWR